MPQEPGVQLQAPSSKVPRSDPRRAGHLTRRGSADPRLRLAVSRSDTCKERGVGPTKKEEPRPASCGGGRRIARAARKQLVVCTTMDQGVLRTAGLGGLDTKGPDRHSSNLLTDHVTDSQLHPQFALLYVMLIGAPILETHIRSTQNLGPLDGTGKPNPLEVPHLWPTEWIRGGFRTFRGAALARVLCFVVFFVVKKKKKRMGEEIMQPLTAYTKKQEATHLQRPMPSDTKPNGCVCVGVKHIRGPPK